MAEKVTKIPNQNNINNVITAQIENMVDIVKVVVKAATDSAIKYSSDTIDKLKTYSDVVETLFSNKGAVIVLTKAADTFQKLNGKDIKEENIKKGFKAVKMMQSYIKDLVENLSELKSLPEINLDGITKIFDNINSLRAALEKDDKNKKPMWFKFFLLKLEIKRAISLIKEITEIEIENDTISKAQILTGNIKNVYKEFTTVLESFNSIELKNVATYFIKIWLLKNMIASTINSLNGIDSKSLSMLNKKFKKNSEFFEVFTTIASIIEMFVSSSKNFKKLNKCKKIIIKGVEALKEIVEIITINFNNTKAIHKKTIENISSIYDVVNTLVDISKKIIFLGLIAVPTLAAVVLITFIFLPAIAIFMGVLWVISKTITFVNEGIKNGFESLASIVLSMLIVSAALVGFALIAPIIVATIKMVIVPFILALGIFALIAWFAFKIIGKLSVSTVPDILAFGLMIAILCGTLFIAGLAVLMIAKIAEQVQVGFWKIIGMIVGMVALSGVLVLLGLGVMALTPFIAPSMIGLGQMLGLIGLILGVGFTINTLANIEVKSEEAKEKTNKIITTIGLIRDELKNLKGTKEDWRQDKRVLRQVKGTVRIIAKIAEKLNSLQSIALDQNKIISNVTNIMMFTQKLQDLMNTFLFGETINESDNTDDFVTRNISSIFHKDNAKKMRKEMRQNKKVLNKVDKVVDKLVGIGEGLVSISELKLTGEFKKTINNNIGEIFSFINILEGKIKEFMHTESTKPEEIIDVAKMSERQWKKSGKALSKVEATIATIYGITDTLNILKDFKFVEGKDGIKGTKDIIITNIGIVMDTVKEIAGIITGKSNEIKVDPDDIIKMQPLTDFIQSLNNGFKDLAASNETAVKNNVDNYIKLIDRLVLIDSTTFGSLSYQINKVNSSFDGVGKVNSEQFESNINNYVKFVDKVNTVDVTKLETTADMFKQMSRFSTSIKGDFDKLAESLAEKLLPVLEELKEVMGVLPEKIDVGFQNTSASIAATNAPATKENITAQVNREKPNASVEDVAIEVASRMNENAKSEANGIVAKLNELISLFKGYGEIARVQLTN